MTKKFYIKLKINIPEELASQVNPDYEIIEGIINTLKQEIDCSCKANVEVTTDEPANELDLIAVKQECKAYKTAFKELKKFVENYPILDEDKENGDKYLNGKLGAMMAIAKKIDELSKKEGI